MTEADEIVMRAVRRLVARAGLHEMWTYTPTMENMVRTRMRQVAEHLQYALMNLSEYEALTAPDRPKEPA